MNDRKTIGNKIKAVRRSQKLTIIAMSKLSGLKIEYINMIEAGAQNYRVDTLIKYLNALEIELF